MYVELYIDVFFLENFMMDSLLLLLLRRMLKTGGGTGRLLFGGAAGSLATCLLLVIPLAPAVRMVLFHTAVNSLMLLAGLPVKSRAQFARAFLLLYAAAAALGAVMQALRPYLRCGSLLFGAGAAGGVFFLRIWKLACRLRTEQALTVEVTVYMADGGHQMRALVDTGNRLDDPVSGEPVCVLDPACAGELTGCPEKEPGFRLIPYRCVGGESVMQVFRARKMCIHGKEDRWVDHPILGVGEASLSAGKDYGMVLNPSVLSG
ncbi:MAG TPA: sigma-E processing peptidase SpoIIGA [Candidatus Mediterraneibacter merdipullorum]|nr:sigma-E processing peptidase SpoIIGA [Candidatus Mediterraneibacter merdipullorum]